MSPPPDRPLSVVPPPLPPVAPRPSSLYLPTTFLAIDPGRATGWALFRDGRLVAAGTVQAPDARCTTTRCTTILRGIIAAVPWGEGGYPADLCAVEEMDYRPGTAGSNPVDLLGVQAIGGVCTALGSEFRFVPVRAWKGSVPKSVSDARTKAALDSSEVLTYVRQTDHGRDAIGIGLYVLDRLGRRP